MTEFAHRVAEHDEFAVHLGTRMVECAVDRCVVEMPHKASLGVERTHGGAIAGLVDVAATAAFWSHPDISDQSSGATIGFDLHYLSMSAGETLRAEATVRRRGGRVCVGEVTVTAPDGREVAIATVTYKQKR